jgi:Tol biopolymer transport system component
VRGDFGPEFSPDSKWIAYQSRRGGQQDIWLVPVDGGEHIRVTDDPGAEGRPMWSADGNALVFTYDENRSHLWVVPVDSGPARQLTTSADDDYAPQISPDGKHVAFVSTRAGSSDIFVVPLSGGDAVPITTESTDEYSPFWSPDGTKILFESRRGGTIWLFVVPATGGPATRLLDWTDDNQAGRWSPDGRMIAFTSTRQSNATDVWVMNADGSVPRRLTTNARAGGAVWRQDGRTLAFAQSNEQGEVVAATMSVSGGPIMRIPLEGYTFPIAYSRTGELLVGGFARGSATRFDAYVYRGGRVEPIIADPTDDVCNAWSPDNKSLVCFTQRTGQSEISIVPAAGGEPRVITNAFAVESGAVWTPDGKSIVYQAVEPRNQIVMVKVGGLISAASKKK